MPFMIPMKAGEPAHFGDGLCHYIPTRSRTASSESAAAAASLPLPPAGSLTDELVSYYPTKSYMATQFIYVMSRGNVAK